MRATSALALLIVPCHCRYMLTRPGTLIIAALIVAALAFYSLKGGFSQKEQSPAAVVQDTTNKLKIEILKTPTTASEFDLKDPAGKQISLSELAGKVVFLNFWATWCLPCIEEMPAMEKLHQKLEKDGLVILAVNFQEGPERVKEFFTKHNLTFTALLDRDGKVSEAYQAWALPVSVLINKRGEIAGRAMGVKDWYSDEALELFRKLLAEE
ncbi:MAG: TlpA family protein disulfide reductase [Candidatus Binatia bacterium]